jgi:hypothetical protein
MLVVTELIALIQLLHNYSYKSDVLELMSSMYCITPHVIINYFYLHYVKY